MLTSISVILFYLLLCFLIIYITRKNKLILSPTEIFAAFGFKVLMGCIYGYIFLHYYQGDDTWAIHLESLTERDLLRTKPFQFFSEYTPETALRNAKVSGNFVALYLADLEYCLLVKTLGIFNIITQGNYYINVVLFNFILFWGHFWLYRTMALEFPEKRKLFLLVIFFLPTAVFWLSGIRSDGLLFFFFGLTIASFYRFLHYQEFFNILLILTGMLGMLIFRSAVAFLMLPGLIAWWLVVKQKRTIAIAFISIHAICLLLFFGTTLFQNYNAARLVSEKQAQFFQLKGNTTYGLKILEPTIYGFVTTFPQAFSNTFLRPFIWEAKGPLQLMTAMGILMFWITATLAVVQRQQQNHSNIRPVVAVMLFFAFFNYLLIGYTVPFPGAIVRYKSIAELCFFTAFIALISADHFHIKKNKIRSIPLNS